MDKDFSVLSAILTEYAEDITEAMEEEAILQGKKAKDTLKRISRVGPQKRKRKYAQSWTYSTEKGRGKINVTVHNKEYRLTHLLEDGHALRNGERTRAFPHIKPTEQEVINEYEKNIKLIIRRMK